MTLAKQITKNKIADTILTAQKIAVHCANKPSQDLDLQALVNELQTKLDALKAIEITVNKAK